MASTGVVYPGYALSLANAGTTENSNTWANPDNIWLNDAAEAQIIASTYDSPKISYLLVASSFDFSMIPTSAVIDGITVEIDRRSIIASSGKDYRVQLATGTTFASLVGTNKAATSTIWPTTSGVATYGGSADTWSAGFTAALLRSGAFSVMLSVQANIANADIGVDFIRATVTYHEEFTGTGAETFPITVAASGAELFTGTGAETFPIVTDGTGVTGEPTTGTGAATFPVAVGCTAIEEFIITMGYVDV